MLARWLEQCNTASQIGSFLSSLLFGYIVDGYGSYDLPFVPMAALLLTGAWLWLKVDPTQPLIAEEQAATRTIKKLTAAV